MMRRNFLAAVGIGGVMLLVGCAARSEVNPSFALTRAEARDALAEMAERPVTLDRPVVVLSGWVDPGPVACNRVARRLRRATGDERVMPVSFFTSLTMERCRKRARRRVIERFADHESDGVIEVDVVGLSMGGLVGRDLAIAREGETGPVVRVRRLYTVGTPHGGAQLAWLVALEPKADAMRPGTDYLARLDEALAEADYELVTYARRGDFIVGLERTAPQGVTPWWTSHRGVLPPHTASLIDRRILADIARRLRGETPFTTDPPAPLPK